MASPAQTLANHANALHSTGPKTVAGKAKTAKNATTHGLATGLLQIPGAEREAFLQFEANLKQAVHPQGALERVTCDQLVHAAWRLRRLHTLVQKLYQDHQIDPLINPAVTAQLRQLTRYRAALEMTFFQTIKQLRELQTRRIGRLLQLHPAERTGYAPQLNPNIYSAAVHTRGDRESLLEAAGYMGRWVVWDVSLSRGLHPLPVYTPVPRQPFYNRAE